MTSKSLGLYYDYLQGESIKKSGSISVQWLGVSGIYLHDGKTGILIDPFLSRPRFTQIIKGYPLEPNRNLIAGWLRQNLIKNTEYILVSHSHYDHIMDALEFTRQINGKLVGSRSTGNLGIGYGLKPEQIITVKPGDEISLKKFKIKFLESSHSPLFTGKVPYAGAVDKPPKFPITASDYKLGTVFSFLLNHPYKKIIHHGSAGYLPGMYDGITTDVLFLGIIGRRGTLDYLVNTALTLKTKVLYPVHFDNLFKPLSSGLSIPFFSGFSDFISVSQKFYKFFQVKTLPPNKMIPV